jgi:hypothetical protein
MGGIGRKDDPSSSSSKDGGLIRRSGSTGRSGSVNRRGSNDGLSDNIVMPRNSRESKLVAINPNLGNPNFDWLHDLKLRFREPQIYELKEKVISIRCSVGFVPFGMRCMRDMRTLLSECGAGQLVLLPSSVEQETINLMGQYYDDGTNNTVLTFKDGETEVDLNAYTRGFGTDNGDGDGYGNDDDDGDHDGDGNHNGALDGIDGGVDGVGGNRLGHGGNRVKGKRRKDRRAKDLGSGSSISGTSSLSTRKKEVIFQGDIWDRLSFLRGEDASKIAFVRAEVVTGPGQPQLQIADERMNNNFKNGNSNMNIFPNTNVNNGGLNAGRPDTNNFNNVRDNAGVPGLQQTLLVCPPKLSHLKSHFSDSFGSSDEGPDGSGGMSMKGVIKGFDKKGNEIQKKKGLEFRNLHGKSVLHIDEEAKLSYYYESKNSRSKTGIKLEGTVSNQFYQARSALYKRCITV